MKDKLEIAKLLDNLGVSFIEGGWPGASPKEEEFSKKQNQNLILLMQNLLALDQQENLV